MFELYFEIWVYCDEPYRSQRILNSIKHRSSYHCKGTRVLHAIFVYDCEHSEVLFSDNSLIHVDTADKIPGGYPRRPGTLKSGIVLPTDMNGMWEPQGRGGCNFF